MTVPPGRPQKVFSVELLPARAGDSIWIEYGDASAPQRILVDAGPVGTGDLLRNRIRTTGTDSIRFELIAITHIDADHIEGLLELLDDETVSMAVRDVWFNGYRHLPGSQPDSLGPIHGERLTTRLLNADLPWNRDFGGGPVELGVGVHVRAIDLPGGMQVTPLAPIPQALAALAPNWSEVVGRAGLDPAAALEPAETQAVVALGPEMPNVESLVQAPFRPDRSVSNATSLALLLEYEGKRLLLTGDASPRPLESALAQVESERETPLEFSAVQVPHHGSRYNLSPELAQQLTAQRYLFSSSGAGSSRHPHPETVARVIASCQPGVELVFNYRSPITQVWGDSRLIDRYGYRVRFPGAGEEGIRLEL